MFFVASSTEIFESLITNKKSQQIETYLQKTYRFKVSNRGQY